MYLQKPPLGTQLDWNNYLNKGVVMHLAMNEGHGDKVQDLSMNGNHGTLNNMAFPPTVASGWNSGQTGIGLKFDGTDDYVDCGNDVSLNPTEEMSTAVWIYPKNITSQQRILNKYLASNRSYSLIISASGYLQIEYWDADGNIITPADSYSLPAVDQWYHVTTVFDGTTSKLYINGNIESTESAGGKTLYPSTANLDIGRYSGNIQFFDGLMADARIHNRALSAKEVMNYYINPWQVYLDEDD